MFLVRRHDQTAGRETNASRCDYEYWTCERMKNRLAVEAVFAISKLQILGRFY